MKDHIIAAVVNDLRDTAIKFHNTQQLRERLRGCIEPLLSAAAPQVVADELAVLNEIADLFSIGAEARKEPGIILANVRNTVKFANLLHAVEREFFMSPDDENECLVNYWVSTEEQYLDSMRSALQAAPVQAQEPTNENEWLVANLMKALRPLRDFAYDRGNPYQTGIAPLDWEAFAEAANRMVRDYKPCAPVQPVAVPDGWRDAALESAVQAVAERAGESETIAVISVFDAIRSLKKNRHALPESCSSFAAPTAQGDATQAAQIEDGYEGGTCIADPTRLGGTVHLHYISPEHAESAFEVIAEIIDATIAAKAAS